MMKQLPWHPWSGCSPISPTCLNCYAVPESGDLVQQTRRGPVWNGTLRFNEDQIALPARTARPSYFQVCPHGDVFHENAPDDWIDRVFDEMKRERGHFYAVLTKRGDRMLKYLRERYNELRQVPAHIAIGVSVERQLEANQRIPALVNAPAQSKYLTVFAPLGPIDFNAIPGVSKRNLRTIKQAMIGSGWLTAPNPQVEEECARALRALGIVVTVSSLSEDVARRGF